MYLTNIKNFLEGRFKFLNIRGRELSELAINVSAKKVVNFFQSFSLIHLL